MKPLALAVQLPDGGILALAYFPPPLAKARKLPQGYLDTEGEPQQPAEERKSA